MASEERNHSIRKQGMPYTWRRLSNSLGSRELDKKNIVLENMETRYLVIKGRGRNIRSLRKHEFKSNLSLGFPQVCFVHINETMVGVNNVGCNREPALLL